MGDLIKAICIPLVFWHCTNKPNSSTIKSTEVKVIDNRKQNFIDFVSIGDKIWAITEDSLLVTFDIKSKQKSKILFDDSIKLSAIGKDREGQVVVADTKNRVSKYSGENWAFSDKSKSNIKAIFYTKQNNEYLLTNDGILSVKDNKSYLPDSSLNHQLRFPNTFRRYTCTFIDSQDNIWLGYNHGEWGGDIYIFSTTENRFITPKLIDFEIELNPIFAFTESFSSVYFSGGLSHLGITSGYIGKFQNFTSKVIFNNEFDGWFGRKAKREGHYIGPITYNLWDSCLYFYSQHGFYKGKVNSDLSKIENWTNAIKPELSWTYGQSNATGYAMNVIKIVTTGPNAFLFLTKQNGIGYFDGRELIMFR